MLTLIAAFLTQDSEVDRILLRLEQARQTAQTEEEYWKALDAARGDLTKFLERHGDGADAAKARYHLAEITGWRGDLAAAIQLFDAMIARHPADPKTALARFQAAEYTLQLERDADARKRFEGWLADYPKDERVPRVKLFLALIFLYERKFDEAAKALEVLRSDSRDKPETWAAALQLVICHHLAENATAARAVLEDIIRDCPERSFVDIAKKLLEEFLNLGNEMSGDRVVDEAGTAFDLAAHRGKVVVLYFFSPAMPFASDEARFLRRLHEQMKGKDLVILGVSLHPSRKTLEQFRTMENIGWTLFHDGKGLEGRVTKMFSVRGMPSLWVLDRKGRSRFYNISGRDLRIAIEKLLEEK